MKDIPIAFIIYGEPGAARNALTEEKYTNLAAGFTENGFAVDSVLYHDSVAGTLTKELLKYKALLVWVNPIEQGTGRKTLDALLADLASKGCFVSSHPDVILKMGIKEILYLAKDTEFGGDVKLYPSFETFKKDFPAAAINKETRILKQYRGNGGNGVFKIDTTGFAENKIIVTHATKGDEEITMTVDEFFANFESYFENKGVLIDQAWNQNIINGMVRCYISGNKVAGFGYQEVNALFPKTIDAPLFKPPGKRYYYSEDCMLFRDLRDIMENKWIAALQKIANVKDDMLPVIWDADFFIDKVNAENAAEKYSLCEINVSCVSPFPESAIPHIIHTVKKRIGG